MWYNSVLLTETSDSRLDFSLTRRLLTTQENKTIEKFAFYLALFYSSQISWKMGGRWQGKEMEPLYKMKAKGGSCLLVISVPERRKFPLLYWTEYYTGKLLIVGAENQLFPVAYASQYIHTYIY